MSNDVTYSVEKFIRVYENDNGSFFEVRPDQEGLDCVEVVFNDSHHYCDNEGICVSPEMAKLIAAAIVDVADSIIAQRKNKDYVPAYHPV